MTAAKKTLKTGIMYDVIIIGLGGMGSAAAYELANSGARVLGLEQYPALHDQGSSFGKTRMIRKAYMEGAFYVPLLERAYKKWKRMNDLEPRPLVNLCGGLYCALPGDEIIEGTIESAKTYDIPLEVFKPRAIKARFPAFNPDPDMIGLFEPSAGYVNPEAVMDLYFRLGEEKGADLKFSEGAQDIKKTRKYIEVETQKNVYQAKKLVITTGAWLKRISGFFSKPFPLEIWRMVLHWFEPDGSAGLFMPKKFVPNLWRLKDGHILYGFPWTEEEGGIKYAFHDRYQTVSSPKTLNREVKKKEIKAIRREISRYAPAVPHRHMTSKVCLYTMTPDRHFIIGPSPWDRRIILAGGFSGHGYKFVPVVGEILRDLVQEKDPEFDLKAFSPKRFSK